MVSAVLTSLSLVFVAAGLTLLITSVALSRRARRYRSGMQALLLLGGQNLEPLDIPQAAWMVLQGGGWQHMSLVGEWFGHPVSIVLGTATQGSVADLKANALVVHINSGNDVQLDLKLAHGASRGEERLFAEQLARVFVLLLETGVRARTESLSVALAERARLSLYLQHDMRNLAQWVGWVCADFAACTDPAALEAAALRLRENAPLAQERAHRLIAALGKKPVSNNPRLIDLRLAVHKAAHMAGVELSLTGQAQAWIARGLLARTLDNLFSNLAPNWRETRGQQPVLQLRVVAATTTAPAMAEIDFFSTWPQPSERVSADKLFEPLPVAAPAVWGWAYTKRAKA